MRGICVAMQGQVAEGQTFQTAQRIALQRSSLVSCLYASIQRSSSSATVGKGYRLSQSVALAVGVITLQGHHGCAG